jgi:F0F1-type ATP synthase delta subunit
MVVSVLGPILLFQCIFAVVVIYFLKRVLEIKLRNSAVATLENLNPQDYPNVSQISVVCNRDLNSQLKQRILRAILKNFGPQARVNMQKDTRLLGGVKIQLGEHMLDYSLRKRLRESGFLK